eukprot:Rhum_TRINITY_DN806_c0_g2::Rhum_TRINITY_DN806_c0_g2_i1::g.2423::m.2423
MPERGAAGRSSGAPKWEPGVWPDRLRCKVEDATFYQWPERLGTPEAASRTFGRFTADATLDDKGATTFGSLAETVSDAFWACVKEEVGMDECELDTLTDEKRHDTYVPCDHTRISWGTYDPHALLEFARVCGARHAMAKAVAELQRRLAHGEGALALRGFDLREAASEADLEAGLRGTSAAARVTDPETQRQLLRLKQLLTAHIAAHTRGGAVWTEPAAQRALGERVAAYLAALREFRASLEVRASYPHGVHDHNANKRHEILRRKEAAARRLVRPEAVRGMMTQLNLQRRGIRCMDSLLQDSFPALETLSVSGNALRVLENAPSALRALHACGNGAEELRASAVPPATLLHLGVAHNALTSLEAVAGAEALVSVDAAFNHVYSLAALAPLAALPGLRTLCLEGNPLSLLPYARQLVLRALPQITSLDGVATPSRCC